MPIGQSLPWKRGDLLAAAQRLTYAVGGGLIFMLALAAWRGGPAYSAILSGLAAYVILGSFADHRPAALRRRRHPLGGPPASLVGLPRQAFGSAFAHAGIGMTLLGLAATGWGAETHHCAEAGRDGDDRSLPAHPRRRCAAPGSELCRGLRAHDDPFRRRRQGRRSSRRCALIRSRKTNRSEAGIATLGFGQVYMSIADVAPGRKAQCQDLLEAARRLDLDRRACHGVRRRAVA